MISRLSGACLGLLAFGVAILRGLWVGNPVEETLSRALWASVLFCGLGLVIGMAADQVVNEHVKKRREEMLPAEKVEPESDDIGQETITAT